MGAVRLVHQEIEGVGSGEGLARERSKVGGAQHSRHMVRVIMRKDDQAGPIERPHQPGESIGIKRLALPEGVVSLAIHAGVEHNRAVLVDHLKSRPGHGDGPVVAALDHELPRPDAGRELHSVDRRRRPAWDGGGEFAQTGEIGPKTRCYGWPRGFRTYAFASTHALPLVDDLGVWTRHRTLPQ